MWSNYSFAFVALFISSNYSHRYHHHHHQQQRTKLFSVFQHQSLSLPRLAVSQIFAFGKTLLYVLVVQVMVLSVSHNI